jgi:hypothetical protein
MKNAIKNIKLNQKAYAIGSKFPSLNIYVRSKVLTHSRKVKVFAIFATGKSCQPVQKYRPCNKCAVGKNLLDL